jgi:anaerobic selenocysteine-containing dehydrogenase
MMNKDGVGLLFAPTMNDGPFPEHYEPFESPVPNAFSSVELNPAVVINDGDFNKKGFKVDFPIVATTYRVEAHWQSGSMTRNQEWLSEIARYMFVEISEELAKEKGIKNKDKVIVTSARGEINAYAMVTKRYKPFTVRGKKVHQLGMPWNFGFKGYATGDIANRLTPHIGDANTMIPEYKAFLCDIRRAD